MNRTLRGILHRFPGDIDSHVRLIVSSTSGFREAQKVAREAAQWGEKGGIKSPTKAILAVIRQVRDKKGRRP